MNSIDFDQVMDLLNPFFVYCKETCSDDLGEVAVAKQLLEIVVAITDHIECDTKSSEGHPAKLLIDSALRQAYKSFSDIERDISRTEEERKAEVIAQLSVYQRKLLGITVEDNV